MYPIPKTLRTKLPAAELSGYLRVMVNCNVMSAKSDDNTILILAIIFILLLTQRELWIRNEIKNLLKWDYSTN